MLSERPDGPGGVPSWAETGLGKRYPAFVVATAVLVFVAVLAVLNLELEGAGPGAWRPLLHARLNATSATLLIAGLFFIRRRMVRMHLAAMVLAGLTTVTFLVSYLHYHSYAGSTPFQGQGWSRPLYFTILLSHTILAAFVAPLAASLYYFAARRRFDRHRKIARWALPLWLYVSITGVLIYCMLYLWFPGS